MAITQEYYYKITDLHNLANRESLYALDSADTPTGQALTDKSILGEDEADFFKRLLKSAATAVYKRLHRRGRGVASAYQFDVDRGEADPGYVIFTLCFPDNFDENLVVPLDTHILDALVFHTLSSWFSKTKRNYLADDFMKQYQSAIDEVKSLIEMRTSVRRPSYFWGKYYTEVEEEETT